MSASDPSQQTAKSSSAGPSPAANPKQRSCVTCRARKVRCNKASPCSHCQRAGIVCVYPTPDRTPRWARRLNQQMPKDVSNKPSATTGPAASAASASTEGVAPVMDRLHKLESLVRELSTQLRQEQQDIGKSTDTTQSTPSPAAAGQGNDDSQSRMSDHGSTQKVQQEFGRLVLDESKSARYVSSGFWSRIKDEVARPDFIQEP
ncbi:hypothetical protein QBC37DRAFT_192129 [Rhypophila decipiens]|uniref:Zn(2)-C6 fungal-type domain-containing protein n=1 Tax=Rhypophila decipiens TaxID=261697 RepID=A0AAN6Y4K7_9PEZI|nr:hypothetical protein QBC37DRAFT_192129 [Rhypophila decipiens]